MDQWMNLPYHRHGFIGARAPLGLLLAVVEACVWFIRCVLVTEHFKIHAWHDVIL